MEGLSHVLWQFQNPMRYALSILFFMFIFQSYRANISNESKYPLMLV